MENTLKDITGYIDFLRSCGFNVYVSCFKENFRSCLPTLLEYEVHTLPVCIYLKSRPEMLKRCIKNKRLLEMKKPASLHYFYCYAGIEEYVYPITCADQTVMCINISGYRGKFEKSARLADYMEKRCGSAYAELYSQCSQTVPDPSTVVQMIRPLEYMVKKLYSKCKSSVNSITPSQTIFHEAITYIYNNYTDKITCADVAAATRYSESYLRRIFRTECGKGIMEYINNLRLSRAEQMLKTTEHTVTDIAFLSGFCDSNYFSAAFKKTYGLSPTAYRKKHYEISPGSIG